MGFGAGGVFDEGARGWVVSVGVLDESVGELFFGELSLGVVGARLPVMLSGVVVDEGGEVAVCVVVVTQGESAGIGGAGGAPEGVVGFGGGVGGSCCFGGGFYGTGEAVKGVGFGMKRGFVIGFVLDDFVEGAFATAFCFGSGVVVVVGDVSFWALEADFSSEMVAVNGGFLSCGVGGGAWFSKGVVGGVMGACIGVVDADFIPPMVVFGGDGVGFSVLSGGRGV